MIINKQTHSCSRKTKKKSVTYALNVLLFWCWGTLVGDLDNWWWCWASDGLLAWWLLARLWWRRWWWCATAWLWRWRWWWWWWWATARHFELLDD